MADITVTIPYDGSFTSPNLRATQDIIQLDENRFILCIHQNNQDITYLGVYDFDDYQTTNTYNVRSQRGFFFTVATGCRLYKLTSSRFLLVRNRGAYVYDVDVNGEITNVYSNGTFFTKGVTGTGQTLGAGRKVLDLRNFVDNKLHGIEDLALTVGASQGTHVYIELSFDPLTNILTRTELFNFRTVPALVSAVAQMGPGFISSMYPVPGSNRYFLTLSTANQQSGSTATLRYMTFINEDFTVDTEIPIPVVANFQAVNAVALSDTRIIFHQTAGGQNTPIVVVNNNVETLPFIADVSATFVSEISREVLDLIPLDFNHYFMVYSTNRAIVVKTRGDEIFDAKNGYTSGTYRVNKNNLVKINDNLFSTYTEVVTLSNPTRLQFTIGRLYQPDV